tara:strand:+ start:464 stop:1537 length:1074 start_codon:yes stop_codon:yes gene_type:complete
MTNKLVFTRYLYNKDEVELSLLECILKNKKFSETYYWITELYESNNPEDLWQFLYKIYYDFYYINYQQFIHKINSYYKKWKKSKKIKYVLHIIYNLGRAHKNINYDIFLYRTYYSSVLTYITSYIDIHPYKGDIYEKLLNYSITNKNNEYISYYLKKNMKNRNIERFLEENFNIILDCNGSYKNKFHLLLCKCLIIPKTENKFIFKKVPTSCYIDVMDVLQVTKNLNNDISRKILREKRLFEISENLGCFKLSRSNYVLNQEFWYNWEYHAYKSEIWKDRFDKYKIKIDPNKKLLEFEDDDEMEEFYSQYGYEPDEQPKHIQEKSTKYISSNSIDDWIQSLSSQIIKTYKIEKKLEY